MPPPTTAVYDALRLHHRLPLYSSTAVRLYCRSAVLLSRSYLYARCHANTQLHTAVLQIIFPPAVGKVGLARQGSGYPPPSQLERAVHDGPDADTANAMGCFASPTRLGHYGSISGVCVLSYEPTNVSISCLYPYMSTDRRTVRRF